MRIYKIVLILVFILAGFLRFYNIANNPPGLYIDEVSIGNDAYSILKTGKDGFGQKYPLFFRSFGDYKMPGYIYAVASSMSIFGKTEFAVRFPSALAGTLTIVVIYFLLKQILQLDNCNLLNRKLKYLPILSAFLLAISPWHLHFSRGGFEVNMAVFLFLLASLFVTFYLKTNSIKNLFIAFLLYVLSIYTYHTFRILSPLAIMIVGLSIFFKKPTERIKLIVLGFICFLFLFPIFQFSLTQNGMERFSQTSAFVEYPTTSVFEKIIVYPMVYLKNYFSYFSLDYLFNFGDGIGRHQVADNGLLFYWQFPFIIVGLYSLIREKRSYLKYFVLGILILSPIPASIARPSPHTLRNLLSVIPYIVLSSIGLIIFLNNVKKWLKLCILLISCVVIYSFISYIDLYCMHYSKINILDWDGGFKLAVGASFKYSRNNYKVIIDEKIGNIIQYFNFYNVNNLSKPEIVSNSWIKPKEWGDRDILYIRPYYGNKSSPGIIENVILPNLNRDVVFQFWRY